MSPFIVVNKYSPDPGWGSVRKSAPTVTAVHVPGVVVSRGTRSGSAWRRKLVLKYSPDQERDEAGRWTDGDIPSDPEGTVARSPDATAVWSRFSAAQTPKALGHVKRQIIAEADAGGLDINDGAIDFLHRTRVDQLQALLPGQSVAEARVRRILTVTDSSGRARARKSVHKYSPDQEREPAGSSEGGRFAGGGGGDGGREDVDWTAEGASDTRWMDPPSADFDEVREHALDRTMDEWLALGQFLGDEEVDARDELHDLQAAWSHVGMSVLPEVGVLQASVELELELRETSDAWKRQRESESEVTRHSRDMARALYNGTQSYLEEVDAPERVELYRGVIFTEARVPRELRDLEEGETAMIDVSLKPLSSFSASRSTARFFAQAGIGEYGSARGYLIQAGVPRDRIFATGATGLGSLVEKEAVVLGGEVRVRVTRLGRYEG